MPASELGGKQPVLALAPGVGDVDIVLASELLEAGRCIASGFVTPDRTTMIASTSRSYLVTEKMAMGDGRLDSARLVKAVEENAQAHLLLDMEALARQTGAMINAVMLGLIAGCGRLPISPAHVRSCDPRRRQSGRRQPQGLSRRPRPPRGRPRRRVSPRRLGQTRRYRSPAAPRPRAHDRRPCRRAARDVVAEGVRRLAAYQDTAYARALSRPARPRSAAPTSAHSWTAGCCARSRDTWRCACPMRT